MVYLETQKLGSLASLVNESILTSIHIISFLF